MIILLTSTISINLLILEGLNVNVARPCLRPLNVSRYFHGMLINVAKSTYHLQTTSSPSVYLRKVCLIQMIDARVTRFVRSQREPGMIVTSM